MGSKRVISLFCATVTGALLVAGSADAAPIIDTGVPSIPTSTGEAAVKNPIPNPTVPEQNPFMTDNPNSNIHNDTWMTDTYNRKGPLGENLQTDSYSYQSSLCGSITFDSQGRILTSCPSIPFPPQIRLIDPDTLAPIDTLDMPTAPNPPNTPAYQNFTGGGYFYVDQNDKIWAATKTNHIFRIGEGDDGDTLTIERDYDLTGVLDADTERITSALPDFDGRVWFVSKANAKIGTLDRKTGDLKVIQLDDDEEIENSFSVASNGVFIVSNKRMYKLKANKNDKPKIVWQQKYPNSGIVKPSQVDAGSGTTPTNLAGGYVAITDNADPMNVVVYRSKTNLKNNEKRVVCKVPVFSEGASATENSLMGTKRSLIVENNYGYQDPFGPNTGAVTEPGLRPRRHRQGRQGLHEEVDQPRRAGTDRRAEAVDEDRPDLHLPAPGGSDQSGLLLDGDRLPDRQDRVDEIRRVGPAVQQQLRGTRPRSRRHRIPGHDRRDHRPPGRQLSMGARCRAAIAGPLAALAIAAAIRADGPGRGPGADPAGGDRARQAGLPLRAAPARDLPCAQGTDERRLPDRGGQRAGQHLRQREALPEPRRPYGRRTEHRHALFDRPPRSRQGADRAQPSRTWASATSASSCSTRIRT